MRPGVNIAIRETPPARVAPTDTGVWFVAGFAEKGSILQPIRLESMGDFTTKLGSRVSYSILYDALDTFFHEGGATAYVARVAGPAPVYAGVTLNDAGAAATLRVEANSPGDWGNALNVQVTAGDAGGEFKLIITHDTLGLLETSPSLVDKAAAFAWAANSQYIRLVDQASVNDPAIVAAQNFVGGTDDRTNATDAHWEAALNRLTKDLGPGQVSMPGRTTAQAHTDLGEHAASRNRVALLDFSDTATVATHVTSAASARDANARFKAAFVPNIIVPGLTAGTTRTVPSSALVAGQIARRDALGSPNVPAAGNNGQALWAIGLSQEWPVDSDRQTLNEAGVNVVKMLYGGVRIYGWRSLANPATDQAWLNLGNVRMVMEIASEADAIGEEFMFEEIDGNNRLFSRFASALSAMLLPYWQAGSLYGAAPDQAFVVDVGSSVNTPTTIANRELRAVIAIRPSPFAEEIRIEIVKVPITEEVT